MSCREKDLLVSGGREEAFAEHRAGCAECDRLGRDMENVGALARSLTSPAFPRSLRESLLAIPRETVSCEGADTLLAHALEGELAPSDEARWKSHLSRCSACSEVAETLFTLRGLEAPVPAPWLATRITAAKATATPRRSGISRLAVALWSPRGVITLAYAAAVAIMLTGFNPADLAREAGAARLEDMTGSAVAAARSGAVERIGAVGEKAYRSFEVLKGRVAGYGRATFVNALALVMRTESPKTQDRGKPGPSKGVEKIIEGMRLAGKPEPAPRQITSWRT
jgi:hypothetical protein